MIKKKKRVRIRFGEKTDLPTIRDFLKDSWLGHFKAEPSFFSREAMTKPRFASYFRHCFDGSHRSFLLVAEQQSEVVGLIKADVVGLPKFFAEKRVFHLDDIYVKEKSRGKGVADALMVAIEEIAKKMGIRWLRARVYAFNRSAQKAALRFGLRPLFAEYFKVCHKTG